MSNHNRRSRVNKFEKRRKNNRAISIFLILGAILAIVFLWVIFFGGSDNESTKKTGNPVTSRETDTKEEDGNDVDDEDTDDEKEAEESKISGEDEKDENSTTYTENNAEVEIKEEPSSDRNVIKAYTGNWQPLGTKQEGVHTTDYTDGSMDRIEIKEAVISITGLEGESMEELWVGNGGDQKVIATVSDPTITEIYRVYLSWIQNEGWHPTMVEELNEYDGGNL